MSHEEMLREVLKCLWMTEGQLEKGNLENVAFNLEFLTEKLAEELEA